MYMVIKIGTMKSIVAQTPSRHLIFVCFIQLSLPRLVKSIEKIQVLQMESSMRSKMQVVVVLGDLARVSATLRMAQTYMSGPM